MNKSEADKPHWVTLCLLAATILLAFCIFIGCVLDLDNNPAPSPLLPWIIEPITARKYLVVIAGAVLLATIGLALAFKHCTRFRDICNALTFIQITIYLLLWTAFKGGLSASMYGAGYLSLFSVAMVIPKTNWMRMLIAIPVAVGAIFLALGAQNVGRELFISITSMFGTVLGVLIAVFLTKSMRPGDNTDASPAKSE